MEENRWRWARRSSELVLAILLVHANELVSSDRLIEELWPEPPETAANALQVYVGQAPQGTRAQSDRGGRRASS